jgi:cytochrome c oxidase subunit 1
LRIKTILSLDAVKGLIAGLAGTAIGIGITVLVRQLAGIPAWKDGPVLTAGIVTGVISYLIGVGVFRYWTRWATGASLNEESPKTGWTRYFSVDTNHKIIGVQYLSAGLFLLPFAVILQLIGLLSVNTAS